MFNPSYGTSRHGPAFSSLDMPKLPDNNDTQKFNVKYMGNILDHSNNWSFKVKKEWHWNIKVITTWGIASRNDSIKMRKYEKLLIDSCSCPWLIQQL